MGLLCLLLCWMTLYTVWRKQGNHPNGFLARIPPTTKSGGIRKIQSNWLRVLDTAECSQVDQRVRQQLLAIVPLLDAFTAEPPPLARVFPGKGPLDTQAARVEGSVEQPLPPALGVLAVAGLLGDGGDQAGIEDALPLARGVKAAIQVQGGTSQG
jgi:hypothetical protein